MDNFLSILAKIIVWPLVLYGCGLILWWTILPEKWKEFSKEKYEILRKKLQKD